MPLIRESPIRRCAVVTGTWTSWSRATPNVAPNGSYRPITRNRTPEIVTWRPTGSTSPNSLAPTSEPRTATRRRVSTSVALR